MQTKLQSQRTWIQDQVDKIANLEKEIEKVNGMFANTKQDLEATARHLQIASQQRDEQTYVVDNYVQRQAELFGQASELLSTVEESVSDVGGLHSKLARTEIVHAHNTETFEQFKDEMEQTIASMQKSLQGQQDQQNQFYGSISSRLGNIILLDLSLL